MSWNIEPYETEVGNRPVEEFLDSLPKKHKAKATHLIIQLGEKGVLLGAPHTKKIKGKLWELRIQASPNIYRVFYFTYTGEKIILLHAFAKKTQETPTKEINIAEDRMKDYMGRCEEK